MASLPINPTKKQSVLDLLINRDCVAARDISYNMNYYEDIVKMIVKWGKAFDGDNALLDSLLSIFTSGELNPVGIYYNETSGTITNPKIVAKCTGVDVTLNSGLNIRDVEIIGASTVGTLLIEAGTQIESLVVAGGSTVDVIEIEDGSLVDTLLIKSENGQNSTVTKIDGNGVNNVYPTEDSTFGGFVCVIPPLT